MTRIRNATTIRCAPEKAFDYLSDMRNELHWNPAVESVEKQLTTGQVAVGTRYRAKWKSGPPVAV
ncbi:SRPBCC family protein, partial [Microbacterium sp.]|uniref:SRPBCC family protein n=1 Tax=Microbacterium sp. TaxID=51671 RepID=UPI002E369E48